MASWGKTRSCATSRPTRDRSARRCTKAYGHVAAPARAGAFELSTQLPAIFTADHVVVATGGYQIATIPRMAERLPPDRHQTAFVRVQERRCASARRGAGGRHRPIRLPDRRGPASRWTQACISASAARRAPRGAIAARTWSIGWRTWATTACPCTSIRRRTRPRQGQPLRHRTRRRTGHRPAEIRRRRDAAPWAPARCRGARAPIRRRPHAEPRPGRRGRGEHQDHDRQIHRRARHRGARSSRATCPSGSPTKSLRARLRRRPASPASSGAPASARTIAGSSCRSSTAKATPCTSAASARARALLPRPALAIHLGFRALLRRRPGRAIPRRLPRAPQPKSSPESAEFALNEWALGS